MILKKKQLLRDQTSSGVWLSLRTSQDTNKMKKLPSSLVMSENPFWDFVFMAKKNCILYFKFLSQISSSGHIASAQLAACLAAAGGEKQLGWGCC